MLSKAIWDCYLSKLYVCAVRVVLIVLQIDIAVCELRLVTLGWLSSVRTCGPAFILCAVGLATILLLLCHRTCYHLSVTSHHLCMLFLSDRFCLQDMLAMHSAQCCSNYSLCTAETVCCIFCSLTRCNADGAVVTRPATAVRAGKSTGCSRNPKSQ